MARTPQEAVQHLIDARVAQGLPPTVTDAHALATIAAVLSAAEVPAAPRMRLKVRNEVGG